MLKGLTKSYVVVDKGTGQFTCKGVGGVGWAFTSDFSRAVKFTLPQAEKKERCAKFDARIDHIDNYKPRKVEKIEGFQPQTEAGKKFWAVQEKYKAKKKSRGWIP